MRPLAAALAATSVVVMVLSAAPQSGPPHSSVPAVVEFDYGPDPGGAVSFTRGFASYVPAGSLRDLAVTLQGDTVLALQASTSGQVTLVRIAR